MGKAQYTSKEVMDKLMGIKKLERLAINLFDKTDEDFRRAKLAHVKECIGKNHTREWAEADFDERYPNKDA